MRFIVTVLLLVFLLASTSCDAFRSSDVKVTFVNATDTLLCDRYHASLASNEGTIEGTMPQYGACRGRSGEAIRPHARQTRVPGCGDGAKDHAFDLTILLVIASDGREIYSRTANCKAWNDAHATFIIEKDGEEFLVTDSLPDDEASR